MVKLFFPKMHIMVPASNPHPENTQYKVSIGEERWGEALHPVIKVQMVYDGTIAGRRSPSYPLGTDDFHRVQLATEKLIANMQDSEIKIY